MQGLRIALFLAVSLTWSDPTLPAGRPLVADTTVNRISEPIVLIDARGIRATSVEIRAPGATFLKLNFSQFHLPPGVTVEVSDPAGSERYRYAADQRDAITFDPMVGEDGSSAFSAMSISADTVRVSLSGDLAAIDGRHHALRIDHYLEGLPVGSPQRDSSGMTPDSSCGSDERSDAVCWAQSHPQAFDRSRPVGKVVTTTGIVCTAWRAGSQNRIFTNEHCIANQADVSAAEVWFNYQSGECGGTASGSVTKVAGSTLLAVDETLDFALFTVSNFDKLDGFGWLGLEVREGVLGEEVFIPQHGYGQPKQISIASDMNDSGLCQIDDVDHDGYGQDTDLGYFCDTVASSSGSPVIAAGTGRVLALHHLGGCVNSGAKMSLIWPMVSQHFDNNVPAGDREPVLHHLPPEARISLLCEGRSCVFNGTATTDGRIVSYEWDFGDGKSASGSRTKHTYTGDGMYRVTLRVRDDREQIGSASTSVKIATAVKLPPVINPGR